MGAGLAAVGPEAERTAREALGSARLEALPSCLRPLSNLGLDELREARRRLARSRSDKVSASGIAPLLGFPLATARRLCRTGEGPASVGQVLTTLTVASCTHSLVKARFVFGVFDRESLGYLDFDAFCGVLGALFKTASCINEPPVGNGLRPALVEIIALPLFEPHRPRMHAEAFITSMTRTPLVFEMLRRFSQGALDLSVHLVPWKEAGLRSCDSSSSMSSFDDDEDMSVCSGRQTAVAAPKRPSLLRPGWHRRQKQQASARVEDRRHHSPQQRSAVGASPPGPSKFLRQTSRKEGCLRPRSAAGGGHSQRPKARPPSSRFVQIHDEIEVPKKQGYFQAVIVPEEAAIRAELAKIEADLAEAKTFKDGKRAIDLDIRQQEVRRELKEMSSDSVRRYDYRRLLQEMRQKVPAGRLWTASREHIVRGGVLPPSCTQQLRPKEVLQRLVDEGSLAKPATDLDRQVSSAIAASGLPPPLSPTAASRVGSRNSSGVGAQADFAAAISGGDRPGSARPGSARPGSAVPPAPNPDAASSSSSSDSDGPDTSKDVVRRVRATKRDVLLAFELFRRSYWKGRQHVGAGAKHDRTTWRLRQDIDRMLEEQARADEVPRHLVEGVSSNEHTLKSFLKIVFPTSTKSEVDMMVKWIVDCRSEKSTEARAEAAEAAHPAQCVRDLVEVFDTIDIAKSGRVSLEAIEQFLCGELLTKLESRRLGNLEEQVEPDFRRATEHVEFVDFVRDVQSYRFLYRRVPDRKEWSLSGASKKERLKDCGSSTTINSQDYVRQQQLVLSKTIGKRMDKLAKFLDQACYDATSAGADTLDGGVLLKCLEVASLPRLRETPVGEEEDEEGSGPNLRVVRLYYRHLLGCAIKNSLHRVEGGADQPCYVDLGASGTLDVVSFISVFAQDQVLSCLLGARRQRPTVAAIRAIADRAPRR